MSQIKSYLSIDSVPSQQCRTPPKNVMQTLTTNNSLSLSNTLGSFDNKSLWNRRTFYNSHQFVKNQNFQSQDLAEEQEQQIQNNSSVTLNPVITQNDIYDLANTIKMVNFLALEINQRRNLIQRKVSSLKSIKSKIFFLEQSTKLQIKQFMKKQKSVRSKSLSVQKVKRKEHTRLQNEIIQMRLGINQMKRSISTKKCMIQGKKRIDPNNNIPISTERPFRQRIYVPISAYSNREFTNPHQIINQRSSQYPQQFHQYPMQMKTQQLQNRQSRDYSRTFSDKNHPSKPLKSVKMTVNQNMKFSNQKKDPNSKQQSSSKNFLDIVQERLQFQNNFLPQVVQQSVRNSTTSHQRSNPEMVEQSKKPSFMGLLGPALNQELNVQGFNINILKQHQKSPDLNYFNDQSHEEQEFSQELLMNRHRSKKSIKQLKQSNRSITKWKKDQEDEEMVQLLRKSINSKDNLPVPKRNDLGAILTVSNLKQESPERSREGSRENTISRSRIDISIDNSHSDQKTNKNQSRQSAKKNSVKSVDRQNIVNSEIGIILNDMSDSHQDSPIKSPAKNMSIARQISKIEQIQDDGNSMGTTPVDFKAITFEPKEAHKFITPMGNSLENKGQKQESIITPPLSRPPSLIEQELQDSRLQNSLLLSSNAKSVKDSPYKVENNRLNATPDRGDIAETPQEEEDFLGGIRLVAMSRISREKQKSSSNLKQSDLLEAIPVNSMTQSDLLPADPDPFEGEELRKSTNSAIIKKGSAIQRSTNRKQGNSSFQGSKGSSLSGRSGELAIAIQQAEEEEEEMSNMATHRRNRSNLAN